MEEVKNIITDTKFLIGVGLGGMLAYACISGMNKRNEELESKWSNKAIKYSVLDLVGHTPILRLDSLSRALGNEIFVDLLLIIA